jgi:hypothetical protein
MYLLNVACRPICKNWATPYLVGSVWTTKDFRDVDIRCMLDPDDFKATFGNDRERLLLTNAAYSIMLQRQTGLPVDFQFQDRDEANAEFDGPRNPLGLRF